MYLDILIGIVVLFGLLFGLGNGFFSEFLSIFGVLGDFWLTQKLTPTVLEFILNKTGFDLGEMGYALVYGILFLVIYAFLSLIISLIDTLFKAQKKGIINRILGGIVGLLKGLLFSLIIIFLYDIAADKFTGIKKYGENARSKQIFLETIPYVEEYIPEQFKGQLEKVKNNELVNKYWEKL
jgi:membrane protein required for colicin V production